MADMTVELEVDDPFVGFPVANSQPERLVAIAKLRGLEAPDPQTARVLELACASGQNLLPMAERYPQATFVGIDSSARKIAEARATAAALGLKNITFDHQRLQDFRAAAGKFDYIIAHHVYSWVDAADRDKLLAICRAHLAPQGIAYVCYDAYPGWHVHDMLRTMMLYEGRFGNNPAEKVASARALLEFLKTSVSPQYDTYKAIVEAAVENLLKQSDNQLRFTHLGREHTAFYFHEFAVHAERHTLQYLGDGSLGFRYLDSITPQIEHDLTTLTADLLQQERYRDVLRQRTFRQTLLCHDEVSVHRTPQTQVLAGMYMAADIRTEGNVDLKSVALDQFVAQNGATISTSTSLIKAALLHLGESWPNYVSYEELVAAACERLEAAGASHSDTLDLQKERVAENLLLAAYNEIVDFRAQPQTFTTAVSAQPLASPLARWQMERGEVATNRKHEAVQMAFLDNHVARLLDGTRDFAKLIDDLLELSQQGQLLLSEEDQPVQSPERRREFFEAVVPGCLERLARTAFLIA